MTVNSKISNTIDLHSLTTGKLRALWAISALTSDTTDRFTPTQIANFLIEDCQISTSRQAITYALENSGTLVHKNGKGFKLMAAGIKELNQMSSTNVHVIRSGQPYEAKYTVLKEIFASLHGPVMLCDPYIDAHFLDLIYRYLAKDTPARILTKFVQVKPEGAFQRQLAELRKEGFQIEIGCYSKSELHDRYIMDDKVFWLSGNSLNHLGDKESFLVSLGDDIRNVMEATFNGRWKSADKI